MRICKCKSRQSLSWAYRFWKKSTDPCPTPTFLQQPEKEQDLMEIKETLSEKDEHLYEFHRSEENIELQEGKG